MNTSVTFPIAKLLKDKSFEKPSLNYYFEDGELRENKLTGTNGYYGEEYSVSYEELLQNWNDNWLTKKTGERCFGCGKSNGYLETYSAPTIVEVIMWLYETHEIWIHVDIDINGRFRFIIRKFNSLDKAWEVKNNTFFTTYYKSPTEAYSVAIEYTLKELL